MPSTKTLLKDMSEIQTRYFMMQNWDEYIARTTDKIIDKVEVSLMPIYDLETSGAFETIPTPREALKEDVSKTSIMTSEITMQREFMVVSEFPKFVNLTDLVESTTQEKAISSKLIKKLKEVLRDLQEMAPDLYESLMKAHENIEVEEIIAFLEFTGAVTLPKDLELETLFEELRLAHSHG